MTSGRFWLIAAVLSITAVAMSPACGSGGQAPCTNCPPIEGLYTVQFAAVAIPDECTQLGVTPPRGPLDIERAGSGLTATWDAVKMQGTLFQSHDFTLLGNETELDGGRTQFSVSGRYIPGSTDGGLGTLSGSFSGTYNRGSAQGPRDCSLYLPYTATQQR